MLLHKIRGPNNIYAYLHNFFSCFSFYARVGSAELGPVECNFANGRPRPTIWQQEGVASRYLLAAGPGYISWTGPVCPFVCNSDCCTVYKRGKDVIRGPCRC